LPSPPATNSTGSGSTGDPGSIAVRGGGARMLNGSNIKTFHAAFQAEPHNDEHEDYDDDPDDGEDNTARLDQRRHSASENVLALQRVKSLTQRNRLVGAVAFLFIVSFLTDRLSFFLSFFKCVARFLGFLRSILTYRLTINFLALMSTFFDVPGAYIHLLPCSWRIHPPSPSTSVFGCAFIPSTFLLHTSTFFHVPAAYTPSACFFCCMFTPPCLLTVFLAHTSTFFDVPGAYIHRTLTLR
jgi:hypothetical protein